MKLSQTLSPLVPGVVIVACMTLCCFSPLELDRTPCPCGDGYSCCRTLSVCLRAGSSCPLEFPPSSGQQCKSDDDCPTNEVCQTWTIEDSDKIELAGPETCHQRCNSEYPCSDGERCQLAPNNGKSLSLLEGVPMCVAQSPSPPCEGWNCDGCTPELVGKTFCDQEELYGCLITAHPACGFACKQIHLSSCITCSDTAGIVDCETGAREDAPCEAYPCDACSQAVTFCDGNTVKTCLRATYGEEICNELCAPTALTTCPKGCEDGNDGLAACVP